VAGRDAGRASGRAMIAPGAVLQSALSGLVAGTVYGLYALGLGLVFGILRVVNLAHGELVLLGGYAAYWLFAGAGVDPLLSLPAAALASGAAAAGAWRLFVRRLPAAEGLETLALTYGLGVFLANLFLQLFSADLRTLEVAWMRRPAAPGIPAGAGEAAAFVAALAAAGALHLFLQRTEAGMKIRAVGQDREAARLAGVDVQAVEGTAFVLGGALAGLAGPLLGALSCLSPEAGAAVTVKSFILAVLAGLGSMPGLLAAGALLGVGEALTVTFAGAAWREAVGFILFLAVLAARPRGLFGRAA